MEDKDRCRFGASGYGTTVVVTGGEETMGGKATAHCFSQDVVTLRTKDLAPMCHKRYAHAQTTLRDNRILVCGGSDESRGNLLTSVEIYSPKRDKWAEVAPMPHPLMLHTAATTHDNKVIVGGGTTNQSYTDHPLTEMLLYDPVTNKWSTIPLCKTMSGTFGRISKFHIEVGTTLNITYRWGQQFLFNYKTGVYHPTHARCTTLAHGSHADLAFFNGSLWLITAMHKRVRIAIHIDDKTDVYATFLNSSGHFAIFTGVMYGRPEKRTTHYSRGRHVPWTPKIHRSQLCHARRAVTAMILALLRTECKTQELIEGIVGQLHGFELEALH